MKINREFTILKSKFEIVCFAAKKAPVVEMKTKTNKVTIAVIQQTLLDKIIKKWNKKI